MTVKEYLDKLLVASKSMTELCVLGQQTDSSKHLTCAHCPMHKAEGKSCVVTQLIDIRRTLEYAVNKGIHNITEDTPVYDPLVIILIKRAVILGYSVYTLRACDSAYIEYKNLLDIPAYPEL